ncbi:hypothetical protein Ancab_006549 [Ancistrocladus abbreviatus]
MNAFHGKVPCELSSLSSLQILNLANNNLSGRIPACLGDLKAMAKRQTIDHYLFYAKYRGTEAPASWKAWNSLVGEIPEELMKLSGMLVLNLSRNQISGQIPKSISALSDLSSIDLSNNNLSGLCGDPLTVKCPDDYSCKAGPIKEEEAGMDDVHNRWFYLSIASGFAAGVLGPYLILAVRKSWADAYFGIVDKIAHIVLNN